MKLVKVYLGIIGIVLMANGTQAQDIKTIFAYQHVIPMGNIPRIPKNANPQNGEPQPEIPFFPKFNYYIYVAVTNAKAPVITKLMLGDRVLKVRVEKVTELPVLYRYQDGTREQQITMVDQKQKNVYQLIPEDFDTPDKNKTPAKKILIYYKLAGKIKLKSLGLIKEMPASVVY